MNIASLDAYVHAHRLLDHPFYQRWSAGTLPVASLIAYAQEYGQFVRALPTAWTTLGDEETEHEEHEHAEAWDKFAIALGTSVGNTPQRHETQALIATASRLFAEPATAAGALYAFEVQQPETATSKLDGLQKYYSVGEPGHEYFRLHTANHHEAEKLRKRIAAMTPAEQEAAAEGCREMALALYNALSGLMDPADLATCRTQH